MRIKRPLTQPVFGSTTMVGMILITAKIATRNRMRSLALSFTESQKAGLTGNGLSFFANRICRRRMSAGSPMMPDSSELDNLCKMPEVPSCYLSVYRRCCGSVFSLLKSSESSVALTLKIGDPVLSNIYYLDMSRIVSKGCFEKLIIF